MVKKDDKTLQVEYLKKILNSRVYDVASETPLDEAVGLSRKFGARFLLKREDLQCVHSFKLRGAYNKMSQLPREALAKGVLACWRPLPETMRREWPSRPESSDARRRS